MSLDKRWCRGNVVSTPVLIVSSLGLQSRANNSRSMKTKHQVLIIGNSLTANNIRQLVLEEAGYSVFASLGVTAGLEAARHSLFDVAVVDGYFPPEDVKALLITLRSFAIPSILIAPRNGSAEQESLADVHVNLEDASWLTQLVESLVINPPSIMKKMAVPLGVGEETVQVGEHLAWLFANDEHFARAVHFLEVGLERGDAAIIYGDASDNERVDRILNGHGFNCRELLNTRRLIMLDAASIIGLGDAWMDAAREVITSVPSLVRILGCGALRLNWPSDEAFLKYEGQVNTAMHGTCCIAACLYDMNEASAKRLLDGALGKHKTVVTPSRVVREHAFIEPGA